MSDQDTLERTVLPIPTQPRTGLITYDAKDPETKYAPITPLRPKGASNVLLVGGENHGCGGGNLALADFFSAYDGCDVGVDTGAPVSPDYGAHGNEFNGVVKGVQLAIAEDAESVDHLVSPEEAVRIAMARQ